MTSEPERQAAAEEERILSMRFGGKTLRENLEAAIEAGHVVRNADNTLSLPPHTRPEHTYFRGQLDLDCTFLNLFMFKQIYAEATVPFGCRDCYKVKVEMRTLRQLMAVKDIAETFSCASKSGSEVDRAENPSLYATYFYLLGLDKALALYAKVRDLIDKDGRLGPSTKVVVKRGCTNYERACGPSDNYTFDPRQAEIEAYFQPRFRRSTVRRPLRGKIRDALIRLNLIRIAYRIGDDTYKDFTEGKDLLPGTVDYARRAEAK